MQPFFECMQERIRLSICVCVCARVMACGGMVCVPFHRSDGRMDVCAIYSLFATDTDRERQRERSGCLFACVLLVCLSICFFGRQGFLIVLLVPLSISLSGGRAVPLDLTLSLIGVVPVRPLCVLDWISLAGWLAGWVCAHRMSVSE